MSFIPIIKPDFSSRGKAEAPPKFTKLNIPPPPPPPVGDGIPFDYNKPPPKREFIPVYAKEISKPISYKRVESYAVSTISQIATSQFSPNTETYPTSGTSYFVTQENIDAAVREWSRYPAVQNVDMSGNSLLGAGTVATDFLVGGQALISSLGANSITSGVIRTNDITSLIGNISTVITRDIVLDGNILTTAGTNELLLNGIPIATTQNISSLADWAYDPAVSTVVMGANAISFGEEFRSQIYADGDGIHISSIDDVYIDTQITRVGFILVAPAVTGVRRINGTGEAPLVFDNVNQTVDFHIPVNVSTLQNVSTINGLPFAFSSADWAQYKASQDVNMNSNNLTSTNQINLNTGGNIANLTAGVGDTLLVNGTPVGGGGSASDWAIYPAISTIKVNQQTILADNGINVTTASAVNIVAQNGLNGAINMTAEPGYAGISGGGINMTANGGNTLLDSGLFGAIRLTANPGIAAGVTTGGLISLTANSGGALTNLTSAIKLTAGSVVSYAGVVSPIGSLFGYNYVYGTLGVSLAAGLPPGALQTPGTVYVYGTSGIVLNSDVYTTAIYPYWSGLGAPANLTINGRTTVDGSASVVLNNVDRMSMEGSGAITGVTTINGSAYPPSFTPPSNLVVSTIITSTINGLKPTNISTAAGVFSGTVRFSRDSNVFLFSDPTTNTLTYGLNSNVSSINSITIDNGGFASIPALSNVSSVNGVAYPPSPLGKYGATSGALALTGTFASMATMTFTTTINAAPILSWGNFNVLDGGSGATIEVRLLVNGTAGLVISKTLTNGHNEIVSLLGNGTGPTPAGLFNVVVQARVLTGSASRVSAQVSALSQFTLST